MKITEIAFSAYPVTDVKRSRAFYEGTLGLTPSMVSDEGKDAWIEYDIAGGTLAITNIAADMWKPSSSGASIALEVDDFDKAVEHLRSKNVPFAMGPFESPVCHMVIIEDPDGSKVTIHKRKSS